MFKTSIPIRKKIAKEIFEIFEKTLFIFTGSNQISGYIVVFFHYLFVMFLYLLLISQNKYYYILGAISWLLLILAHLFFNGCIFIRLERYLWNTNRWFGPWILPLKIFENIFKIKKSSIPDLMCFFYYIFTSYIVWVIFRRGQHFLHKEEREKINKKDDEQKNISHKESHLESPPNDLEYHPHTNDPQFLEIQEQLSK